MKAFWKRIYAYAVSPFRLTVLIRRGPGKAKGHLAGRYTRPNNMEIEPSADYLIG